MTDLGIVDDEDASYLDIDHILMEEQKLSCQAKLDLIDLDFRRQKEGNVNDIYTFSGQFLSH